MSDYILSCCSTADLTKEHFEARISITSASITASTGKIITTIWGSRYRFGLLQRHAQGRGNPYLPGQRF